MARDREKLVVPKLLREIHEFEAELKRVKNSDRLSEADKLKEAEVRTKQLRQLKPRRYKQQQQNSRATHRLFGERPTKYWSKIHKERKPQDLIQAFEKNPDRSPTEEPRYESNSFKMAKMARNHHNGIQQDNKTMKPEDERELDIRAALNSLDVEVNAAQQSDLGGKITYEECELSLRFAKNSSAPGMDSIPFEFWKTLHSRNIEDARFPDRQRFDVILLLKEVFEDMRKYGVSGSTSFAEGWMAPIYKEKGECTKVANYRPITLLNTDYKLLSKSLAVRLADIAPELIHKAQAGFIPGCKIHNHMQLARMMMIWAEENEANGAIVALDQEKAYDKIAHDYLWRVLEQFGVPNIFIDLVQSL